MQLLIPPLSGRGLLKEKFDLTGTSERQRDMAKAFSDEKYLKTLPLQLDKRFELTEKTLFIGFAETATALGQAVFVCFSGNCTYIHTTRNDISGNYKKFNFVEEHSHAPEQYLYIKDNDFFRNIPGCPD